MSTATAVTVEELRAEVRSWIAGNWDLDITVRQWWARLFDAGLAVPTWPAEYGGRSLPGSMQRVITEELAAAQVVSPPAVGIGVAMAGPTLLALGTEEQKRRYLPAIAKGEESWCQLWSEPGAGSDLPALAARAVADGDGFVVNGQKVWNSAADIAQRAILLARTDPDAAKRSGLTYFIIDMHQDGIDPRPLRQMNGEAEFCEVFLTDAHVDRADIVGRLHDGWNVARVTMGFERAMVAARTPRGLIAVASGPKAGWLDLPLRDVVEAHRRSPSGLRGASAQPFKVLQQLAAERGVDTDPVIRQALAKYYTLNQLNRWNGQRTRDQARARGGAPGPEASITKLFVSLVCMASQDLTFAILGAEGTLWGEHASKRGEYVTVALAAFGVRIGGGTDEIQRNSVAERVLGLPREPGIE
jgi:alkylation response protein AidB-like acyl-CoA dehydrogenase